MSHTNRTRITHITAPQALMRLSESHLRLQRYESAREAAMEGLALFEVAHPRDTLHPPCCRRGIVRAVCRWVQ